MATIDSTTAGDLEAAALIDEAVELELERRLTAVVEAIDFGTPGYRRRGRNPRFPFVPVRNLGNGNEAQVRGLAYATSDEAVDAALRHIAGLRASFLEKLGSPRYRALRRQYDLPAELAELRADVAAGR